MADEPIGPPPGSGVRLRGLVSRPDLNGRIGVVNGPPSAEQRYPVVVEIDGMLQEAFLKLPSLEPSSEFPSWYVPPTCACGLAHTPFNGGDKECAPCGPGGADDRSKMTEREDASAGAAASSGSQSKPVCRGVGGPLGNDT